MIRGISAAGAVSIATMLLTTPMLAQTPSHVTFELRESGNAVTLNGFGTYNLTGAQLIGSGMQDGFIGFLGLAVGGAFAPVEVYAFSVNPGSFITGPFVDGTSDVGNVFGLDFLNAGTGFITVPVGYIGGNPLSGSTRFEGQSFASLGISQGIYQYEIPNTIITVRAVPEPGAIGLLGISVIVGALVRRRRVA